MRTEFPATVEGMVQVMGLTKLDAVPHNVGEWTNAKL
jgi:hypothetical protein